MDIFEYMAKKQSKEKDTSKEKEKDRTTREESKYGGIPDVDFKRMMGCGG